MALKKSSLWERTLCAKLLSHKAMNKLYSEKLQKNWYTKEEEELRQKARRNLPALKPDPDDIKTKSPRPRQRIVIT